MQGRAVARFPWVTVRERIPDDCPECPLYDLWEWNLWKLKWVRMANHACGFGSSETAEAFARERSGEIARMLEANRMEPPELPDEVNTRAAGPGR